MEQVGWVQRSETHRGAKGALRCRCTHPTSFALESFGTERFELERKLEC